MEVGIANSGNLDLRDLTVQQSIVVDRNNPNAVDKLSPLAFLQWVQYFVNIENDPRTLLREYKEYILDWQKVNIDTQAVNSDTIKDLYVSLFRNIAVNFLTADEKRFVTNADYTDPQQVAAIIPLFVRKIKDICLYYASARDEIKSTPYRHNLKSSNYSFDKIIRETIESSFLDPKINKLFKEEGITKADIKNTFSVSFDELYDTETNYYDINPALSVSAYDATGDRKTYFDGNSYEFDPELFLDFDNSIIKEIEKYPIILESLGTNFAIDFKFTSDDLQFLKDQNFTSLINNLDTGNLNLNILKDTLETFSGTTFYYLSTNDQLQFTYGKLFEANEFSNYLNRRFPTILQIESEKLATLQSIGGFFKADKQGIQNFIAFDIEGSINDLEKSKIYVFPDPNKYGNIAGLSRTLIDNPFSYTEIVSQFKNSITNTAGFGNAITDFITKFKGYQSRSESLNHDPTGISRAFDSYDFFAGPKKTIWDNNDIFPKTSSNFQPIGNRTDYLLFTDNQTQVQFRQDLHGNSFGLYKEIYKAKDPESIRQIELGPTSYCLELNGNEFMTISGGTWNLPASGIIELDTNTAGFTGLSVSYIVKGARFFPELEFCKADLSFTFVVSDSLLFNATTPLVTLRSYNFVDYSYASAYIDNDTTECQVSGAYIYSAFPLSGFGYNDCGPFLNRGEDASPIIIARDYFNQNVYLDNTLPSATTTFSSASGQLSASISFHDQYNVYGTMYFRNAGDTIVAHASTVLNDIFTKYPIAVANELRVKVKHFDVVNNILIIETENYLTFNKLKYNITTEKYLPFGGEINYLVRGDNNQYNHFSNTWYDEVKDSLYVAKTNILPAASATNSRAIYFDIYKYTGESIQRVYPPLSSGPADIGFFSLSSLSSYSPGNYIPFINFTLIERPVLSYGYDTGKYILKYIGKDPSNMFYDVEFTFKLSSTLYNLSAHVYKPDMFLHSENFGNSAYSDIIFTKTLTPSRSASFTVANDFLTFN